CQNQLKMAGQYELVKYEKYAKPIKSWIFSASAENAILPTLFIQEQQLKWLNESELKILNLPEGYLHAVFSKGGQYFGLVSLTTSQKNRDRNKIWQLNIYAATGNHLYTIEKQQYYDDALPAVVLSDKNGSTILGQNTTGKLWFYGSNGELIRQVALFSDATYDLERIMYLDLSADGSRLAVVATKRGAAPSGTNVVNPSAEPHLLLFTQNGEEAWRQRLPEFNTAAAAISANGKYVIANSYTVDMQGQLNKTTSLFDQTGATIASYDLLFKLADFSPDAKFLILTENALAKLIELPTGKIVWNYQLAKNQGMITAARLSNNGEFAVLLVAKNEYRDNSFIFTKAKLKVLDFTGKLYQEIDLKDETFEKAQLKFSPDHQNIFIGFKNSYRVYEVNK
ncbi:MAG: hypothetical protein ACE5HX_19755, partial [bacterium]